jgi:dipeptidyl aminopeptidase/acylaminoacyl peptidase
MHFVLRGSAWLASALTALAAVAAADEKPEDKDAAREIATQAPANDIWLVPLEHIKGSKGSSTLGTPRNATHRSGYDNQPFFLPDGKQFYYTSIHEDGQADIWRYDVESGESTRVTTTAESEYSPTVPSDGAGISTVRVEKDGSQRLWRYGADGKPDKPIVDDEKGVGYHAWIDDTTLGLFIVGEPTLLKVFDLRSGRMRDIGKDIGRCIQVVPARPGLAYIEPHADGKKWLKFLQWPSGLTRLVTEPLEGSEDFTLGNDGELYMAREKSIYGWEHENAKWKLMATFTDVPGPITRLAVNPRADLMAFVAAESAEPQTP